MQKRGAAGAVAAALVAATVLGACNARVTPDGAAYSYDNPSPGMVIVSASSTTGSNNRELFWSDTSPSESNSTVCGTFTNGQGEDQQGLALNISSDGNGNDEAVTVTRNIFPGNYYDYFNFHVMRTGDPNSPFTQFGSVQISALPLNPAVYPLHMCVRDNSGTVQFVVWTDGMTQPSWGDPTWGGQAAIPAGGPTSGQGGFYAGHIVPGTSTTYTNLTVDGSAPVNPD